jgi:signal transduction histidine kinase
LDFPVNELHQGKDAVWASTGLGVLKYQHGAVERVTDFKGVVQSVCVDTNGAVWLAGGGLRCLTPELAGTNATKFPIGEVRTAYGDREGNFWLATDNTGLTRVNDGQATFYKKSEGPAGFISVIFKDHLGELWVGAYSGLSRLVDGKFVSESDKDETSYHIYALFEDREKSLWVGSEEGLQRFTARGFRTYTKRDGLTLNTDVSVCASRDGSIWIGAWGGGLDHFVDGKFHRFGAAQGLSSDFVMGMCEGRDGSMWVGTDYGHPLNRIQGRQVTQWGKPEGFVASVTTALLEDEEGSLWIGTRDGVQRFRDEVFERFTTEDGLSHNKINALCRGKKAEIWIGTQAGLTRWDGKTMTDWSVKLPRLKTDIFSLYEDARGVLWIGTKGDGLLRLRDGVVTGFGTAQGLFSDSIYAIVEDDHANLWLSGSRGIFRLNKRDLEGAGAETNAPVNSIAYGKADGILSSGQYHDVTQPAACRARDGRLWFRTTQGVAVVDPNKIVSNELPPPVVIQEILADAQGIPIPDRLAAATAEVPIRKDLTIAPGRGELEIRYAALSFRASEKNQYRYLLEGVDPGWVEAGTRRVAYYSNLRPGEYRFRVKACNNDGIWNEAGDSVTLVLQPHFWQTWWFYSIVILAAVGLVGGTARNMTRKKMQRALALLEQRHAVEQERSRIARDIHDDIGAGLTEIALTSEIVEDPAVPAEESRQLAKEISARARELVTGMDEIVWAINPRNDTVRSAAAYFSQFGQRLLKPAGIRVRLDIEPDLPELLLSSEQRHNLFLGFKEALNNAIKHARASEVRLSVRMRDDVLTVTVQDNGSGFAPGVSPLAADGLINMRERMTRIGGHCEITSEPNRGTRLVFQLPLNGAAVPR